MNRDLVFMSVQPNDLYFVWQVDVYLANFRKFGYSEKAHILVFKHNRREGGLDFQDEWDKLVVKYQEAKFFFYEDTTGEIFHLIRASDYIPILRPCILAKHFAAYPELVNSAIFYHDSDIVFTKKLDFQPFLEDDINYLSDTKSYIAAPYFDSKIKDVKPEKLEEYKDRDILSGLLGGFGLTRKVAEDNINGSGGAQYLLKNIDEDFWNKVIAGCIYARNYFFYVNEYFFPGSSPKEREDNGFQRWCADMWSVLWTLWSLGKKTKCPPEMDFAWATDLVEKWDKVYIYHDAGASTREIEPGHILFHKRELDYVNNKRTPFEDDLSFVSPKYCSSKYIEEIKEARWILVGRSIQKIGPNV